MINTEHFEFLRRVYFFKDLNDEEIGLVAGSCVEEEHGPGELLFAEGSIADRFYIVIEGRVEVWKNYYEPKPDLLAIHGPGHFFGEMALIDELPRSATVVAKDQIRVLYLYRDDFRRLIRERSSIAISVMTAISFMLRSSNELYVDDLRKRNAELEKANVELERAQAGRLRSERLSTLGKFSSLILHDIRNPLSALKGQLQLMQMQIDEPEKLKAHIATSLDAVGRLERLASEFLDYSRGEIRLDMTVTTPGSLLRATEADLQERITHMKNPVSVEIDLQCDDPAILDADRVRRALHNVADNACKAMASTGGKLVMRSTLESKALVFEVTDSGEGMSDEVLSHVFEPFYSASGQGGTGLGMLIVKNIVEAHGGHVNIKSAKGKGTSVFLIFPLRA